VSIDEGFEKWKQGIDRAGGEWNFYDGIIKSVVMVFNEHLKSTPSYPSLDWRLVKAMLWTESGPHKRLVWTTKPLQIGVPDDPGLNALLGKVEGGELIIPRGVSITPRAVQGVPRDNIMAAVAYLLMRMADYGHTTVIDEDAVTTEYTVRAGDNLSKIARACGSTIAVLQKLNPGSSTTLKPGQLLKTQRASIQKVIVGWKSFTPAVVARRYNGNGQPSGDARYAQKLEYALAAIRSKG
jgi:LysM domain